MNPLALAALISREWRTSWADRGGYIVRASYAGAIFLAAAAMWIFVPLRYSSNLAHIPEAARSLFGLFCRGQFVLATLVGSLSYARGVCREQERGTMDLLILSPLSRFEILLGKLAGESLGLAALLASGLPSLFLLIPLGGLSPADILTLQAILLVHLLVIGGVTVAFASAIGRAFPAMVCTWLVLALLEAVPAFRSLSTWQLLDRQLIDVRPDPTAAGKAFTAAVVLGLGSCLLGSLVLERRLVRGARAGLLAGLSTRLRRARIWAPERKLFGFLLAAEHPLMRRDCTLSRDLPTVLLWLFLMAVYAIVSWMNRGAGSTWHLVAGLVALAVGIACSVLSGALSVALDRRRGTLQTMLASGVAPEDIVRSRLAGLLMRMVLFMLPAAVHVVAAGAIELDLERNQLAWRVPAALGSLAVGMLFMAGVTLRCALSNRRPEVAAVVALVLAPLVGIFAGSFVSASPVSLALGLPLLLLWMQAGFASTIRKLPRWVLR